MLVNGVSPTNARNHEWRRSEPGARAEPPRNPFRFSTIDVILDLSADAIRYTGRHEAAPARQQQIPPDTYTNSGALAYSPPPDLVPPTRYPTDEPPEPIRNTTSRDGITVVTFDGMMRSPPPEQTPSPTDH